MEFKDQLKFVRNKLHISQTDLRGAFFVIKGGGEYAT